MTADGKQLKFRAEVLGAFQASASETKELLAYNENHFDHSRPAAPVKIPLPDEPFVSAWRQYLKEAEERGVFPVLREKLVQLRFPVRKGISRTGAYRAVTRRGVPPGEVPEASGLQLLSPGELRLQLYPSPAGRVPIIISTRREDFVSLVRALARRNEPDPVPASMGSLTVAGYNNWDRIRRLRELEHPRESGGRASEFAEIIPRKELYRDRFIILSDGPYSGVPAEEMGMTAEEWRRLSLVIRRHHECAHYFTRRLFSSMKNRLIDELIADYMGITAAAGRYRVDWFLRFVGLENFPGYRRGGRLENYRGDPPLSAGAFRILQALVREAAENLERFDREFGSGLRPPAGHHHTHV